MFDRTMNSTHAMPNHFVAGMMWRINPSNGQVEVLVIQSSEDGKLPVCKFPGGTNRISRLPLLFRHETPAETLKREWKDEVGQTLKSAGAKPCQFRIGGHTKHFYLLDQSDVSPIDCFIRKMVKIDRESGRPPETLGPPEWVPVNDIRNRLSPYFMYGHHAVALKKAIATIEAILRNIPKLKDSTKA